MTTIINENDANEVNQLKALMGDVSDDVAMVMIDILFHSEYDDTNDIPSQVWESMIEDAHEVFIDINDEEMK